MSLQLGRGGVETHVLTTAQLGHAGLGVHRVSRRDGLWLYSVDMLRGQGEDEAA